MATISFYAGSNNIDNLSGSGLGFFGTDGFSASIPVASYNGRTYITNSAGTTQGAEANNIQFVNAQSGIIGQAGSGINVLNIPNYQSTYNIRFEHGSAVQVTSAKLYGYDRVSINNPPSGITFKACEVIHPDTSQAVQGSGDDVWTTLVGTGTYLTMAPSPGVSGFYAGNGSNSTWSDTRHDWFVLASISPDEIGSHTFANLVQLEYV